MNEYLEFARKIAKQSGEIIRNNFELGMQKEWKSDDTPLTVTDTAINQLVIDGVISRFPEHGVLGEEDSFGTEREYLWVVDPVDGTMPFSHGSSVSRSGRLNDLIISGIKVMKLTALITYKLSAGSFVANHNKKPKNAPANPILSGSSR